MTVTLQSNTHDNDQQQQADTAVLKIDVVATVTRTVFFLEDEISSSILWEVQN